MQRVGCANICIDLLLIHKYMWVWVSYVSFAGTVKFLLTNLTLESKLLRDFVQTNQRCVPNFPEDVGKDFGGLDAVVDRTEKTHEEVATYGV